MKKTRLQKSHATVPLSDEMKKGLQTILQEIHTKIVSKIFKRLGCKAFNFELTNVRILDLKI